MTVRAIGLGVDACQVKFRALVLYQAMVLSRRLAAKRSMSPSLSIVAGKT
jgi:hypothetical protein